VNFLCEPDAEQAIKEMNGQLINGSKLAVRRQEVRKRSDIGGYFQFLLLHSWLKLASGFLIDLFVS
jgi:RNA recognition motif-containing protein